MSNTPWYLSWCKWLWHPTTSKRWNIYTKRFVKSCACGRAWWAEAQRPPWGR